MAATPRAFCCPSAQIYVQPKAYSRSHAAHHVSKLLHPARHHDHSSLHGLDEAGRCPLAHIKPKKTRFGSFSSVTSDCSRDTRIYAAVFYQPCPNCPPSVSAFLSHATSLTDLPTGSSQAHHHTRDLSAPLVCTEASTRADGVSLGCFQGPEGLVLPRRSV